MTRITPETGSDLAGSDSPDDESGQGMVEYAFILVLVAVVLIVIVTLMGHQVNNLYSNISSAVGS